MTAWRVTVDGRVSDCAPVVAVGAPAQQALQVPLLGLPLPEGALLSTNVVKTWRQRPCHSNTTSTDNTLLMGSTR